MSRRLVYYVLLLPFVLLILAGAFPSQSPGDDPPATPPAAAASEDDEPPAPEKPAAAPEKPAAEPEKPAVVKPVLDPVKTKAAYEAKLSEWRDLLIALRKIYEDHHLASTDAQAVPFREQWDASMERGKQILDELVTLAKRSYEAAPNTDKQTTNFLNAMLIDRAGQDDFETAWDLAELLLEHGGESKASYNPAGLAAYATNHYEAADLLFTQSMQLKVKSEERDKLWPTINYHHAKWEIERELRQQEAEKNDLPRVKMSTTAGDMVLELYEDQAPQTVGNFISLVESGFYDGLEFHRVLPGFMMQGGDPNGDGTGDPNYFILDECQREDARLHFRSSISMAHSGNPNTGGSQFFIMFTQAEWLDRKHTVFGRVIEGLDVLSKIKRIDPEDEKAQPKPDAITKAVVLRKRDHEYKPTKVQ